MPAILLSDLGTEAIKLENASTEGDTSIMER